MPMVALLLFATKRILGCIFLELTMLGSETYPEATPKETPSGNPEIVATAAGPEPTINKSNLGLVNS